MVFHRLLIALGTAALLSACGGVSGPSQNTIEPFSGTVNVLGTTTRNFSWGKRGEIEVTFTSVTPPPANGQLVVQLGQVISGTCNYLIGYSQAIVVNRKIQFFELDKGTYCMAVYDPGVLTAPANFTGNFSHP